jgi:hypothetical protein
MLIVMKSLNFNLPSWIFILSLVLSVSARAAVFGADDRYMVVENSAVQPMANSTAIAILSGIYKVNQAGKIDLDSNRLTNLCSDERMSGEPSLDYACTGFLVAPDLLVTAGHCVYAVNTPGQVLQHETKLACQSFLWLFDYQSSSKGPAAVKNLNSDRLFRCKEIVYATQTEKAPFLDYALIRLDRPAFGRTPFKLAPAPVTSGDGVAMLGYPMGTPVKLTANGRVTVNTSGRDSFLTSLDAFEGNSGSPVFNSANQVVGILIGGTPSANTYSTKTGCERVNRCSEDGKTCDVPDKDTTVFPGYQGVGSEVQRIQPIIGLLQRRGRSLGSQK